MKLLIKCLWILLFLLAIACNESSTINPEQEPDIIEDQLISELNVEDWTIPEAIPFTYRGGIDDSITHSEKKVGYIECIEDTIDGFGNMMSSYSCEDILRKRIKLTGYIKAENVTGWAGMWMRVDPKVDSDTTEYNSLGFDNMHDRPITGTMDWTKCEIVLHVPETAGYCYFGVLMKGTGKVWFNDFKLYEVDNSTEITGK